MHQAAVTRAAGFVGRSVLCSGDRDRSILAQPEPEAEASTLREDLANPPNETVLNGVILEDRPCSILR